MSTRECTDVGEDCREGKRERGRPARMKAGLGQQAAGRGRQAASGARGCPRDGREAAAQEDREQALGRGPPAGLGAGAVWQAGWGSGGRQAAQSTAEAGEAGGWPGLWGVVQGAPGKPRGGGPSPGSAPRGGRRACVHPGQSSRTERAEARSGHRQGPRGCSLSRRLVGPASRQARAADPWIRACLEGTQRVVLSEPRSTPQTGWIAAPAPPLPRRRTCPPAFFLFCVEIIHQVKRDFS